MYIIYFEDGSVKIIEENLGYCIINNRLYLSTHYDMIYEYSLDNVVQIIFKLSNVIKDILLIEVGTTLIA